ncbi:MAG TPA: inorganic phosphate transporter, partial [Candidatus Binatus sp.]|nr:inorganic phosphate transporter [Candidatus Binatus sp.]
MLDVSIGFIILFILALVNGANDVGKSVVGLIVDTAGTPRPIRLGRAVLWGALFSAVGSMGALFVSARLFLTFTQDLVTVPLDPSFALPVLIGATAWIGITTILRRPISSTHTIVGAIVIELFYLYGSTAIHWDVLTLRVLGPMAVTPLLAFLATYILHRLSRGRK